MATAPTDVLSQLAAQGYFLTPTDPTQAASDAYAAGQTDLLNSLAGQGYSLTGSPSATSTINPLYLIGGVVALVLLVSLGGRRR